MMQAEEVSKTVDSSLFLTVFLVSFFVHVAVGFIYSWTKEPCGKTASAQTSKYLIHMVII